MNLDYLNYSDLNNIYNRNNIEMENKIKENIEENKYKLNIGLINFILELCSGKRSCIDKKHKILIKEDIEREIKKHIINGEKYIINIFVDTYDLFIYFRDKKDNEVKYVISYCFNDYSVKIKNIIHREGNDISSICVSYSAVINKYELIITKGIYRDSETQLDHIEELIKKNRRKKQEILYNMFKQLISEIVRVD